jgi:hypothetical protein
MAAIIGPLSLWEYIRGDLPQKIFDDIFLSDLSYQKYFGEELWLLVAEADYQNKDITFKIKKRLKEFLYDNHPQPCKCIEIKNIDIVDMGEDSDLKFRTLHRIMDRGEPYWWLYLSLCDKCNQYWLVAQEERQNDVFIMKRLNEEQALAILGKNEWPSDFDHYETLLFIGKGAGKSVRFHDPLLSISLGATIEDLAKDSPGIKLSKIASLLNLDINTALIICTKVMRNTGVSINLDNDENL